MVRNVPLNNALAAVTPEHAATNGTWSRYLNRWTAWNHLRTASSLGAAALLTLALTQT